MHNTTATTHPPPYSKVCDTSRPRIGQGAATRTDLGTERFIHFLEPRAMLNSLVREHRSEGRPAYVRDAFRHAGFGEFRGRHIANRDVIEFVDKSVRQLVQKVPARVRDTRMDVRSLSLLARPLRLPELFLKTPEVARVVDGFSVGQSGEAFQAQVDADASTHRALLWLLDFDADVQKPVAACVSGKIGSVLDLGAYWQVATLEHPEFSTVEVEARLRFLNVAALQRHPAQRLLAPVAKEGALLLTTRLGVLFADRIHGARVQAQLFTTASRELVQIKPGMPATAKTQGILLPVITEVEDVVDCTGLLVQQALQRLHSVSVDKNHFCRFRYSASALRTCSDTERSVFCASSRSAAKNGSGRKKFARIMRTLYTQNTYDTFGVALYLPGLKAEVSREF